MLNKKLQTFLLILYLKFSFAYNDGEMLFPYKLLVIDVNENETVQDVVVLHNNKYFLRIVQQDLEIGIAKFRIHNETGNLEVGPFYKGFWRKKKPGAVVEATLRCTDATSQQLYTKSSLHRNENYNISDESIDNNPLQMTISVNVIGKIYPPEIFLEDNLTIGYPSSKINSLFAPAYILQIPVINHHGEVLTNFQFYTDNKKFDLVRTMQPKGELIENSVVLVLVPKNAFSNDENEIVTVYVTDGYYTVSKTINIKIITAEYLLVMDGYVDKGIVEAEENIHFPKYQNITLWAFSVKLIPNRNKAIENMTKHTMLVYGFDNGEFVNRITMKSALSNMTNRLIFSDLVFKDFNGSCEADPEPQCPGDMFKCNDNSCIPSEFICDRFIDCSDAEDELPCHKNIAYACEGDNMLLHCTADSILKIRAGNYGRTETFICNNNSNEKCDYNQTINIVKSRCEGRHDCVIEASKTVFGDPCEGVHKYLVVYYQCLLVRYNVTRYQRNHILEEL